MNSKSNNPDIIMKPLYAIIAALLVSACVLPGRPADAADLKDKELVISRYELFWDLLKQADSVWRTIPDTTVQTTVRSHLMPYLEHLTNIAEEITP